MQEKNTERIAFFDNFRTAMILGVLALHAGLTYMVGAPPWWYVIDPEKSIGFTIWAVLADTFLMPSLFFVSGFFAPASLLRKGTWAFLKDKAVRIGIPWIAGVLLFAPLFARATWRSLGLAVPTYPEFVRTIWLGPGYQQAHFWFLGALLALLALFALCGKRPWETERRTHPLPGLLALWLLSSAWFLVSSLRQPADAWIPWLVLFFQPARVALYSLSFLLGALAWRDGWLEGRTPSRTTFVLSCTLACIFALGLIFFQATTPEKTTLFQKSLHALLHCGAAVSISSFLLIFFRMGFKHSSALGVLLAETSYGTYWLHQMILMPLAALFLSFSLPAWAKFASILLLCFVLCTLATAGILRRAPGLRRMF